MKLAELAGGLDHPEGLAWDMISHRIYAGGEAGQIYAVTLGGSVTTIAETGGSVLGLAVDGSGRIYACDRGRSEVVRIDPVSGEVTTYSSGTDGIRMRLPNWPTFLPSGDLLVSDSGTAKGSDGLIWRIRPRGETEVWSRAANHFPNGSALAPDGSALYVVESDLPGVTRIEIGPDGIVGKSTTFVELPGTIPDGVAFVSDGRLLVGCYTPDRIYIVNEGRADILAEDVESRMLCQPTNLTFAGDDLDTLVIVNFGRRHLTTVDAGLRGLPLPRPAL